MKAVLSPPLGLRRVETDKLDGMVAGRHGEFACRVLEITGAWPALLISQTGTASLVSLMESP